MRIRIYFRALNSVPLIYVLTLAPTPHCLDYYEFIVSFEIGLHKSSNFALLKTF